MISNNFIFHFIGTLILDVKQDKKGTAKAHEKSLHYVK